MGFAFRDSIRPEPTKKIKMPKGGGLTKPMSSARTLLPSLARRRLAVPNASRNCGPTSRKTTCRIPTTSSTSPPTKRWQRFSVPTVSVLLVWPSSCPNTFHNFSNFHYTFRKHADNDAPRKTEKKNWTKIILGFKNDPYIHLVLKIPLIVNVTIYIQARFSNLKLSA